MPVLFSRLRLRRGRIYCIPEFGANGDVTWVASNDARSYAIFGDKPQSASRVRRAHTGPYRLGS